MTGAASARWGEINLLCWVFFPVMKFCIIEREREERKAQLWLLFVSESGDEQKVCEATLCSAREVSLKVCWRVSDRNLEGEGELLFFFLFVFFSTFSSFTVIHVKISRLEGEEGGERLTDCLSNLLYLISALNQDPQPATSVLQSQLHLSIQMA